MSFWHISRLREAAQIGRRILIDWTARATIRSAGGGLGPRLWYAGAKPGQAGGPGLKLRKLQSAFPEHDRGYNLVYILSAAPYLSERTLVRCKERKVPTVLNQNGVYYPAWYAGDWKGRNRAMAVAHDRADHVLYQSDFCRRAAQRFLGPRSGPSDILFNAVDTKVFVPTDTTPPLPYCFLITGRIGPHQAYRVAQAVEGLAFARRQGLNCRILVAGHLAPAVVDRARSAVARHGVESAFELRPPYSQSEAPALYRQAHAYLTLTHQDACPSAVIEALASGLPVIHPSSGGIPELAGEAGVVLTTGEDWEKPLIPSAAAIGEAMLATAERRPELVAKARARAVRLFDIAPWLDHHRRVFERLLSGNA